MTVRFYSSTAPEKQLVGSITSGQTTAVLSDTVGLPTSFPYTLAFDYETLGEELVQVNSAAGATLTSITRGIDGTSATSHSAGARVRHTSSARDFSDSRNHENSATNIHGLGVGEEIVGTTKVQTLTNKTLTNATGTLLNIDINQVPPNGMTITNTPALGATLNAVNLVNGAESVWEMKGNGNMVIRNPLSADTAVNTRRLAVVMSDGTTERFVLATGGMATAFPRTGTAATNGGFKVVDPGDDNTRKAIQVRDSVDAVDRFVIKTSGNMVATNVEPTQIVGDFKGAAAQSASFLRVQDSASALLTQVDNAGMLEARRRSLIANDNAAGSPVLQVRGNAAQTANLQTWQNSASTALARVTSAGVADFTSAVDTTTVFSVAGSFTLASQVAVTKAGICTIHLAITRTGGNITPGPDGDLNPDISLGTVNAPFRPHAAFAGRTLTWAATNTAGTGSVVLNATTGDLSIMTWSTGGAYATGTTLQVTMSYPLDFA